MECWQYKLIFGRHRSQEWLEIGCRGWKQRMLQRTVASMWPRALSAAFSDLRRRAHAELALNSDQEKYPLLPGPCIPTVDKMEVGNNRRLAAGARRQSCKVHQGTPTSVGAPDDETVWALARLNSPLIPQAKRPMKIIVPT